ncbi:MAG TPA: PQQ-dependent sugar dehydrogenase [Candidatus Dojkabacteria bacterium]|nr:PQQ-dependent sugar dehydrogenase [Candidatus Dojkabacteria bacterium]
MQSVLKFFKQPIVLVVSIIVLIALVSGSIYYFYFYKRLLNTSNLLYKVDSSYQYRMDVFATDMGQITRIKITPNGKLMFVATLKGEIIVFRRNDVGVFIKQSVPFYTVDTQLEGFPRENGLTGFAFSGDFDKSKEIFLTYTTLNAQKEIKNRVARITLNDDGTNVTGKNFKVIFEGNVTPSQAHQIQNGVGVMINNKSHFMFTIGDAFVSTNAHDLTKDAGKIMLIQRDGSNPVGTRPYPSNPKVQAIGLRNSYDITMNPYDMNMRYLFDDTGNINNDKLMYGDILSMEGDNGKKIDLKWNGDDKSQTLVVLDVNTQGNPNMNMMQWAPTVTPLDINFIKGGKGNIPESTKDVSYFLITLFGQTGSKNNTPGKEIMLGKLSNLDSQPKVELMPFISRSSLGQGKQGQPIGLAIDPLTQDIYFGDLIEGNIYKVSPGENNSYTGSSNNIDTTGIQDMTSSKNINVKISGFSFNAQKIRVKVGTTVTWTNTDLIHHTVTSDTGTELNSDYLNQNDTYKHTFNTVGTFGYHCTPHPFMTGLIEVVQ